MIKDEIDTLDKSLKFFNSTKLNASDTQTTTYGCRHSNPDSCHNCYTVNCAFAREDKICRVPPKSWQIKYERLKNESTH